VRQTTDYLDIISGFRNLENLTIYTQSKLSEDIVDSVIEDLDRQSAMYIKAYLVPVKCGVPFSRLHVNIGGWRKPQKGGPPPRGGYVWDRRREQGRYPERLFIFESHRDSLVLRENRHPWLKPWASIEH
jgi:hypothetical protein